MIPVRQNSWRTKAATTIPISGPIPLQVKAHPPYSHPPNAVIRSLLCFPPTHPAPPSRRLNPKPSQTPRLSLSASRRFRSGSGAEAAAPVPSATQRFRSGSGAGSRRASSSESDDIPTRSSAKLLRPFRPRPTVFPTRSGAKRPRRERQLTELAVGEGNSSRPSEVGHGRTEQASACEYGRARDRAGIGELPSPPSRPWLRA